MRTASLGIRGEDAAARYLRRKGYRITARRWSCGAGEIDLVAMHGGEVVFVEVKTRTGRGHGTPEESVGPAKRERLRRTAAAYMAAAGREDLPYRIDVITVEVRPGGANLRHIEAAVGERD